MRNVDTRHVPRRTKQGVVDAVFALPGRYLALGRPADLRTIHAALPDLRLTLSHDSHDTSVFLALKPATADDAPRSSAGRPNEARLAVTVPVDLRAPQKDPRTRAMQIRNQTL